MYVLGFLKRLTRLSGIPIIIYLAINVLIIGAVAGLIFNVDYIEGICIGLVIYFISLLITLSPIGEWGLRIQNGCKKIRRLDQRQYIEPIFEEVYAKAREKDPTLPKRVRLYMDADKSRNAFATGRRTICISEGLLYAPEDHIKAVLAHEFGHLSHRDTDLVLLVAVGNIVVTAVLMGIRAILCLIKLLFVFITGFYQVFLFFASEVPIVSVLLGSMSSLMTMIYDDLTMITVTFLTWLWTNLGVLLVMKSSREKEFEADRFAFEIGYGNELCMFLDTANEEVSKGLFASLKASHPDKDKRIERLQRLGAAYCVNYARAFY